MRPLSEDLRKRIVAARGDGAGSGRFGVSRKSVQRFWNQYRRTGHCRPKQIGGYRRSRLEGHEGSLRRWIEKQADLTLVELQKRCLERLQLKIGLTALWQRLRRVGLSYKKNATRRRATEA